MLIVGLVLLVACANIANAAGAYGRPAARNRRAAGTRGEPRRVIRQSLTESILLALVAAQRFGAGGMVQSLLWVAIEQVIAPGLRGQSEAGDRLASGRPRLRLRPAAFHSGRGPVWAVAALRATRPDLIAATPDEGTGFGAGWTRSRLRGWWWVGRWRSRCSC